MHEKNSIFIQVLLCLQIEFSCEDYTVCPFKNLPFTRCFISLQNYDFIIEIEVNSYIYQNSFRHKISGSFSSLPYCFPLALKSSSKSHQITTFFNNFFGSKMGFECIHHHLSENFNILNKQSCNFMTFKDFRAREQRNHKFSA